jgi:hypothetical protein
VVLVGSRGCELYRQEELVKDWDMEIVEVSIVQEEMRPRPLFAAKKGRYCGNLADLS